MELVLEKATTALRRELGANEALLWSGQPRQGIVVRGYDIFLIPFSLLWGGFLIFFEYSILSGNGPSFGLLLGIPFSLIPLYVIFGRFIVDATQRRRTYYG